jgi:hypothetical protein
MAPVKRRPPKLVGPQARPITPEPATLPIATRAWCVRDPRKLPASAAVPKPKRWKPPSRPQRFITIRAECAASTTASTPGFEGEHWAPAVQELLFGCAVIGRTSDWRIDREVIFYPDDLPESGVVTLRKYVQELTWRRGARPRKANDPEPDLIWREEARLGAPVNGRSIEVQLLPLSEFLTLFYCVAYEDRALVVGYDLPRELTRLASDWREIKKSENVGGWKLVLWTYRDGESGERKPSAGWRPRLILKRVTPNVTFIEFTGHRISRYRGEFLDLSNLAHALTGRHWPLVEALKTFAGEEIEEHADGWITPDSIGSVRHHVYAIVSLAKALVGHFDCLHPVSRRRGGHLSETRLFSPGGLARAYLTAVGFTPPAVPQNRLGPCAAASFGGRAEVQVRGRPPVIHVDCRRQYATVFLLQGLQALLSAERLEFVEDTATVREFVEAFTTDELYRPETYRKLNVLCWVKAAGEILPVRAAFKERAASRADQFSLGITPRHSVEPIPLWLADVIAAKLEHPQGRAPEVIRAERIVPIGRQTLRKTRLFGGEVFDPCKDQLLKVLVEGAERFNRGEGRHANIAETVRKLIVQGVKAEGNIMAYGALAETHAVDLLPGRSEEVTLLTDAGSLRRSIRHPEDPGAFACPPIAGLVSAGGRLLLAAIHHLVTERVGIVAACDTDGAYIVATQEGGTVYVETRGDKYYEGGHAQPVRALSYSEVENIAALFEPLNPFDRALLPGSPLRVKGASEGFFISAKRYALTGADGDFIDRKESILGVLLAPCGGWVDEAWRIIGEMRDHHRLTPRPWFTLPAVRCLSLTSPGYSREMKALAGMRPWNSFLVTIAIGRDPSDPVPKTAVVVAPYERDPRKWAALDWRFGNSGKPIPVNRPDSDGVRWRLRTMQQFLREYAHHPIPEMLAPDGSPCRAYTRGVLLRRPIRDGERWLILKEGALWGDDPRHAFSVPEPEKVRAGRSTASADWDIKIKPALKVVGTTAVARKMGLAERSARAWTGGEHQPEDPAKVARAIVAVAREAGLTLPIDEHLRAEEICGELPCRATAVQAFIATTAEMLAERHGGVRALARAMARENGPGPEATVRRWLALGQSELRSILELNRIVARLAKFSRSEIRKLRRRIRTESGPAGDRQAVLAYISLLNGAEKPVVPNPEEALAFPVILVVAGLLVALGRQIAEALRSSEVHAQSDPVAVVSG